MGCWFKTCGLSNLHIYQGTPVYVFPLQQSPGQERCYTTALWSPAMLPFESEYNEYGAGENSDQFALEYILEGIRNNMVELEQGENKYHDIAVKREGFNERNFFEAVHEGRLFVKNIFRDQSSVDFVMMRKDVVDDILARYKLHVYRGVPAGKVQAEYDDFGYEEIVREIPKYVRELMEEDPLMLPFTRIKPTGRLKEVLQEDSYRYSSIVNIKELVHNEVRQGNVENAERILALHIKAVMIDIFMSSTRKIWTPGCHEGSQSSDLDGYKLLLNVMQDAITREEEEIDSW